MDYVCGASLLVTATALESVGGFDERFFLYWEDTDLSFRLRERGWRLAVAHSSRVVHRRSLSTGFQSPLYDRHFTQSTVLFFKKHFRFWPLPVLVSCCGRFARRLAKGKTANARAVWKGAQDGLSMGEGLS
jgi:GT2 family glycosyltransferase